MRNEPDINSWKSSPAKSPVAADLAAENEPGDREHIPDMCSRLSYRLDGSRGHLNRGICSAR